MLRGITIAIAIGGLVYAVYPADHKYDACHADWSKCSSNTELVDHYSDWAMAQVKCQRRAEDEAKYGSPEWPWLSFSTYQDGDDYVKTGTALVIEPDAQFQNIFGAKVHTRVVCKYDLKNNRVIDVRTFEK